MNLRLALITAGLLSSVCSGMAADVNGLKYRTEKDIAYYGEDIADAYIQQQCRLDVYYPEGVENFATVVWFHAGGLKQGSRYVPGELMNKGFAVVAVEYRLSPKVKAPAYINDAAAATAWVFKNIERFGGSTNRIVVAGASAGGYLSTMIGLDKSWLAAHGIDADSLAGIVSLSGQAITHVAVREEQGIGRTHPIIDRFAPLYHVRADAPPLMIVTGDRDLELLGRYEENAYFARMMKIVGHTDTELYELEGFDHPGLEHPAHSLLVKFMERFDAE
jgi:acetyl esterase/lipase